MSKQLPVISKQWGESPILFQTEMVKAILEGRKTQTRRVIKDIDPESKLLDYKAFGFVWLEPKEFDKPEEEQMTSVYHSSKYGKPGDLLWVRETWAPMIDNEGERFGFYHSTDTDMYYGPWKPSIHMPKSACRIWLMVEDIRVERVQEISEEDAIAEGVDTLFPKGHPAYQPGVYTNYTWHGRGGDDSLSGYSDTDNARESFQSLWYTINGEESWHANPWLWVIQFRVLSTTGKPSDEVIQRNYLEVTSSPSGEAGRGRKEVSNA